MCVRNSFHCIFQTFQNFDHPQIRMKNKLRIEMRELPRPLRECKILKFSMFSSDKPFPVCYVLKTDSWNNGFKYSYQNSVRYMVFVSLNCTERGILLFSILPSHRGRFGICRFLHVLHFPHVCRLFKTLARRYYMLVLYSSLAHSYS
jgi:hypothetical protein